MALLPDDRDTEKEATNKTEGGSGSAKGDSGLLGGNSRYEAGQGISLQLIPVSEEVRGGGTEADKGTGQGKQGGANPCLSCPQQKKVSGLFCPGLNCDSCAFSLDSRSLDKIKAALRRVDRASFLLEFLENERCLWRLALITLILTGHQFSEVDRSLKILTELIRFKDVK